MWAFPSWSARALVSAALLLGACSPTYNWRELRPEGASLAALMPCKPETATRPVPLLGQPTELHMYSCETAGLTFAIAWAQLNDTSQVRTALMQWQTASLASIRVAPDGGQELDLKLAGAGELLGVQAQGSDHQGLALHMQTLYFSRGSKVYQAAIYGPKIDDEAWMTFIEGLRLP